jgi:hypothetical protein
MSMSITDAGARSPPRSMSRTVQPPTRPEGSEHTGSSHARIGALGGTVPAAKQEQRKPRFFEPGMPGDQVMHRISSRLGGGVRSVNHRSAKLVLHIHEVRDILF